MIFSAVLPSVVWGEEGADHVQAGEAVKADAEHAQPAEEEEKKDDGAKKTAEAVSVTAVDTPADVAQAKNRKFVDLKKLCVDKIGNTTGNYNPEDGYCDYISPYFGICDTHAYNAGLAGNPSDDSERDTMRQVIGDKITVVSQQMYKQYEYLRATLRRLEIQLEKSVLNAQLEYAKGKSENGNSGGLNTYGNTNDHRYLAGASNCYNVTTSQTEVYDCLLHNIGQIDSNIDRDRVNARKQLKDTIEILQSWQGEEFSYGSKKAAIEAVVNNKADANQIRDASTQIRINVLKAKSKSKNTNAGGYFVPFGNVNQ